MKIQVNKQLDKDNRVVRGEGGGQQKEKDE